MGFGNVSERRSAPPQVGVSVVILALGPDDMPEHGATQAESAETGAGTPHSRLWLPLVKRVRQPFLGTWALPGGDLRSDWSLEQSAYSALESTPRCILATSSSCTPLAGQSAPMVDCRWSPSCTGRS